MEKKHKQKIRKSKLFFSLTVFAIWLGVVVIVVNVDGAIAAIAVCFTIHMERVDMRVRSVTTNRPKHQKSIFLLNYFRNFG